MTDKVWAIFSFVNTNCSYRQIISRERLDVKNASERVTDAHTAITIAVVGSCAGHAVGQCNLAIAKLMQLVKGFRR